ncbi:AraC family transcriptional regulator [Flavobacterium sp.]|uniref:helix-turn-helix domain-containing protein n=1 Tax=Flavobacterium sp. TaxID=239 RepID=UPI000EEFD392|nr:helix-turn-helix domain-containing protein [Flavobacterium sp.]HCQ13734.1 AraC family transcriptional regulator [Flavobacterium sp.]
MNDINLLIIVTSISLFISLFLAIFLFTVKTKQKTSNALFATFLIITAIDLSGPLLSLAVDKPSNLGMLRNTMAFLQIPVFYLYVLSVCYSDFKLKPKYLVHLLPFLIANIILLPRFYFVDVASKIDLLQNRQSVLELQFSHILFHTQIVVYLIAVFMLLRKTKKLYLENYAGANINSYYWLFQFTTALAILYLIALVKNIFKFSQYEYISEWVNSGLLIFQLFVTCWYLLKALNNPDLFRNIDSKLKLVADIILENKDSEPLAGNDKKQDETLLKLQQFMMDEKPYLNPTLTIQDVSNTIQIPTRELSILINHQLDQHFYDFVNSYRIEHAKEILQDTTKSKLTILEILYEVGFNSKSSFNTAFKKHTGYTPTDYRKTLLNKDL